MIEGQGRKRDFGGDVNVATRMRPTYQSAMSSVSPSPAMPVTGPNISGCVPHWCVPDAVNYAFGFTTAVAMSREPHAFFTRTQNSEGELIAGVVNSDLVAPAIGDAMLPLWPLYH